MLLANYAQANRNTATALRMGFSPSPLKAPVLPRFWSGEHVIAGETDRNAFPPGYAGSSAWWQAPKAGGLGGVARGTSTATGGMAQGINLAGTAAGTSDATGGISLVVSLAGTAAGTSDATGALVGIVSLAGTAAGTSDATGNLGAIAWLTGQSEGSSTATGDLRGKLWMAGESSTDTALSPAALASAVWSAVAADYLTAGTMGEKVNSAGTAGNPWTEVIEGSYTAAEMLRIIAAALAGELSGAGTLTITIKGVDGATDRITATVDGNGNRTALTLAGG